MLAGDPTLASGRRAELRRAEQAWEDALAAAGPQALAPPEQPGSPPPLREQVYEALSLLQVPAAPKLIATVHEAFFGSTFPTTKVTSLKRDEERSFRTSPFARPYYICAALSADYLSPSRGLLAVSTWQLERRIIGSLSPRVDFLTAAIRVADAIERIPTPPLTARRLLQRFAASIPGASGEIHDQEDPGVVRQAADARAVRALGRGLPMRREAADRAQKAARRRRAVLRAPGLQPVSGETGTSTRDSRADSG